MNKIAIVVLFLLSQVAIIGCANKAQTGSLAGAIAGATVGSQIGKGTGRAVAIFFGAVIGSELGRTIGQYMDEQDRIRTASVLETNKTHQYSTWINPDTGYTYRVKPTNTFNSSSESGPCREFTVDSEIGGKTEQLYGTACRQPDGSWKIQK